MKQLTLLVAAGSFSLAMAGGLQAQEVDSGTFRVTVDDREVGTDVFEIRRSGSGEGMVMTAEGRIRLQLRGETVDRVTEVQVRGVRTAVARYSSTPAAGMTGRRVFGTVSGGVFTAEIRTPTGEAMRQFRVAQGAVVLDEWVAHHYSFLALRPRNDEVPVVIPTENRQVMARLEGRGETTVEVAGRNVPAFHLVLRMGDDARDVRHVWVDTLNRVLRVEIPAQRYVAVRTELPD